MNEEGEQYAFLIHSQGTNRLSLRRLEHRNDPEPWKQGVKTLWTMSTFFFSKDLKINSVGSWVDSFILKVSSRLCILGILVVDPTLRSRVKVE